MGFTPAGWLLRNSIYEDLQGRKCIGMVNSGRPCWRQTGKTVGDLDPYVVWIDPRFTKSIRRDAHRTPQKSTPDAPPIPHSRTLGPCLPTPFIRWSSRRLSCSCSTIWVTFTPLAPSEPLLCDYLQGPLQSLVGSGSS